MTVQRVCYQKNSTRSTMKIAIVCMALTLSIKAKSQPYNLARWKDIILNPITQNTNENCWGTLCNHYARVKRHEELLDDDNMRPMSREFIPARNPWQWICPCETQYNIANLGPGNYPRYLAVASCIPKSCHGKFNFCKLIHYKVHVLNERDLSDASETNQEQFIEQPILPESFGIKWQLKPIKIAVACIAATGE